MPREATPTKMVKNKVHTTNIQHTQPNIQKIRLKETANSRNIQDYKSQIITHKTETPVSSSEYDLQQRDMSSDEISIDGINPQPIMNDYLEGQSCKLIDYLRNSISEHQQNQSENLIECASMVDDD